MNYITDSKAFKAACDSIAKRGKKLDADIQHAAMSAAHAVEKNGNVGYVNMLYLSMPAGSRKAALTDWLLKYAGVVANTEKGKAEMPFKYTKDKAVNLAGGAAEPWYDCAKDKEPDMVFDILAALESLIKKAKGKEFDTLAMARVENLRNDLKNAAKEAA